MIERNRDLKRDVFTHRSNRERACLFSWNFPELMFGFCSRVSWKELISARKNRSRVYILILYNALRKYFKIDFAKNFLCRYYATCAFDKNFLFILLFSRRLKNFFAYTLYIWNSVFVYYFFYRIVSCERTRSNLILSINISVPKRKIE